MEKPDILQRRITIILLLATLLTSMVFVVFPQADLFISGLFASPDGGFPLAESGVLNTIREIFIVVMWLFIYAALLFMMCSILLHVPRNVPLRIWVYPVVVSLAGPLFLVNVILKNNWGRARPFRVEEFGGTLDFTPAYYLSDQCATNCSFTSGEGAAIATVTIVTGVLLWRTMRHSILLGALVPLFVFGAGLRVAMGMHFISDTLLSALFCALIALFFFWIFDIGAHRQKLTWSNAKADFVNFGKFSRRFGSNPKK